jgi:hypothetical protein
MTSDIKYLLSINFNQFIEYSLINDKIESVMYGRILYLKEYYSYYPELEQFTGYLLYKSDNIENSLVNILKILKLSFKLRNGLIFTMKSEKYFSDIGTENETVLFYNYIINNIIYDNDHSNNYTCFKYNLMNKLPLSFKSLHFPIYK